MLNRCQNKNAINYADYGGRGIAVCERWKDFANFYADMGQRPRGKYAIERKDNAGNYEPGNCRWATYKEQSRNKRNNRMIEAFGERLCMTDWAERTGLSVGTIWERLKYGWSPEKVLTKPVRTFKCQATTKS